MNISIANNNKSITAANLLSLAFDEPFTTHNYNIMATITSHSCTFHGNIITTRHTMIRMDIIHQPLSAVGLIWKHYGLQILERLGCIPENEEIVWRRLDRDFISKLDAYYNSDTVSKETLEITICEAILQYGTHQYIQEILQKRDKTNYIEIDNGFIPWREEIIEYNRFTQQRPLIEFVVYPHNDEEGNFCVESVKLFTHEGVAKPVGDVGTDKKLLIKSFSEDIKRIKWD